ncbi:hypothetical protein CRG98_012753 [Punica granatum]|uniref:Uncharacterized protein n=1 Tax=Punica granatum TaxID=22663 RepID=A0A2I0KEF0_PUNGR|nr:hypothetical protein CRG98_012753 [Punica granatum]
MAEFEAKWSPHDGLITVVFSWSNGTTPWRLKLVEWVELALQAVTATLPSSSPFDGLVLLNSGGLPFLPGFRAPSIRRSVWF